MKKSYVHFFACASTLMLNLCSCSNESPKSASVRASILSKDGGSATIKVYPENEYGSIINGAVVLAENSASVFTSLEFSNENQCYSGTLTASKGETYTITVKSNAFDGMYKTQVPHVSLTEKPVITTFTDSLGNDALLGESLSASCPVQISWNLLGTGVCYQVSVKTSLAVVWTASTSAPTVSIPAGVLSGGTYYVSILAQKTFGDRYFQSCDYYSASSIESSKVVFYVE